MGPHSVVFADFTRVLMVGALSTMLSVTAILDSVTRRLRLDEYTIEGISNGMHTLHRTRVILGNQIIQCGTKLLMPC